MSCKTCQRKFSAYCGFRSNIHRDHGKVSSSTRKQVDQEIILQCSLVFCKQVCSNLKELNRHLKGHIDDGSNITCPYNGCENLFETTLLPLHTSVGSTNHVPWHSCLKYEEVDMMDISNELHLSDNLHDDDDDDDDDDDELLSLPVTQETKDLYLKNLALCYLKLQSKYLLPASTIQRIMEELQVVHCLGQSFLRHQLILKLQQDADRTGDKIEEIRWCHRLVHFGTSGRSTANNFIYFSVIPDVTRPESAVPASSSEPQPSTSRQSHPPQPLPTVSPNIHANFAHEFVIPCHVAMSCLTWSGMCGHLHLREMVRLIINVGHYVCV